MTSLRMISARHERLLSLLRWLEARGGSCEAPILLLQDELDMPHSSVRRMKKWAVHFGIVTLTKQYDHSRPGRDNKGQGPDILTMRMSVREWLQYGPIIRESIRYHALLAKRRAREARLPPKVDRRERMPEIPTELWRNIELEAQFEAQVYYESLLKPILILDPVMPDDVDAWAAFG